MQIVLYCRCCSLQCAGRCVRIDIMTILIFVAVLVVLILIHELGHFIFAKIFGVRVDEFGIGYPPKAMKLAKFAGTEYTLNWLPFGGFVRLFGENQSKERLSKEEKQVSFEYKKPYQKILILFAGAFFNFLLGWFLFAFVFYSGMPLFWDKNYVENARIVVTDTKVGSPAQIAGIKQGDILEDLYLSSSVKIRPKLMSPDFVASFIAKHTGESLSFKIKTKDGKEELLKITPAQGILDSSPSSGAVGVEMTLVSNKSFGVIESLWLGFKSSLSVSWDVLKGLAILVKNTLTLHMDLSHVAGPVGIASMVGQAASVGFVYLLYFMALISVNLAVINLLPVPALDGGRIVFVIYEWIFAKKAPAWLENGLNIVGFVMLILLMLLITYHDIARLLHS